MHRILSTFLLSAALMAPVALRADDHHDKDKHRYYDPYRKDYHEWNERENRAYRHWLQETHRRERDWMKANKRDQRAYWEWRHAHENWDDHR
jgi:hypothetical protein